MSLLKLDEDRVIMEVLYLYLRQSQECFFKCETDWQAAALRLPDILADCGPITIATVWHSFEVPNLSISKLLGFERVDDLPHFRCIFS